MRLILILWIIPIVVFWGWYGLSANDFSMGFLFLSRAFHDHMFRLYGSMLGVPPQEVPMLIAGTFAFDTMLLAGMSALRWHKKWFPQTKQWVLKALNMAPAQSVEQSVETPASDVDQFSIDEALVTKTSMSRSNERSSQTLDQTGRSAYPMHPAE
ncbi:MAG: DUF6105 family protein [Rhizobiaceae bacterium]